METGEVLSIGEKQNPPTPKLLVVPSRWRGVIWVSGIPWEDKHIAGSVGLTNRCKVWGRNWLLKQSILNMFMLWTPL